MDFTCCAAAVAAMIERLIQIDKASLQFLKSPKKTVNSVFNCKLYKGTRDVTAVGQFQGFPHKTDLVQTSEIPKTAFPLIPHLSSCIKALKSETKQIE